MGEINWIKLSVNIFDDEKIKIIKSITGDEKAVLLWIKLLCLAGKSNNKGFLTVGTIPYDFKMLSTILNEDIETISQNLDLFNKFGLIEEENQTIKIKNWEKHQSIEAMEKIKEQTRKRVQKFREKDKKKTKKQKEENNIEELPFPNI